MLSVSEPVRYYWVRSQVEHSGPRRSAFQSIRAALGAAAAPLGVVNFAFVYAQGRRD